MAKRPQQNPADLAKQASKLGELKVRILFLIGALIVYRDDGQCLTLSAWFDFYNARQTIEAGIKENVCARHGIEAVTEHFPLSEVNAALAHLAEGKARYRLILENDLD